MVMVMMRASSGVIMIRMTPLAMTSKLRMRMTTVGNAPIDNVAGWMGLDYIRLGDRRGPDWAAEPSFVLALFVTRIVFLSIVGNGEVAVVSGERTRCSERSTVGAE